jgi:RHS repeat-associated protein
MGTVLEGQRDASGQMYMRNRMYDPQTGQFTQTDPIGIAGGLNTYGFAAGDPVSYSDPYGLCPGLNDRWWDITDCPPGYLTATLTTLGAGAGGVGGAIVGGVTCSPTGPGALACAAGGASAGAVAGGKAGMLLGSALDAAVLLSEAIDGGASSEDDGGLGRWSRSNGLNASSSTTQNLFANRSMNVTDFIGRFRKGSIREVFPSEFMDKSVDEALRVGGSTVRKLLTDGRFVR